jgi:hypothetical protein
MQQFFEAMAYYDFSKAAGLAVSEKITGGWEVWFQVELAMQLLCRFGLATSIKREIPYPDAATRCDFYIEYGGGRNPTYVELKCQLPGRGDTINNVLGRFKADIEKQKQYPEIAGFCFMASSGPWADPNIADLANILNTMNVASAFVLRSTGTENQVGPINSTSDLSFLKEKYFFLIGISAWPDDPNSN